MPWAAITSSAVARRNSAPSALRSLSSLSSWSPRSRTITWRPSPLILDRHDERLHERARRQAEVRDDLVDGPGAWGRPDFVDEEVGRRHPCPGLAHRRLTIGAGQRHLGVGRVAALAAEDDLVLTGVGVGHVLVAHRAAHHARVALDHHHFEAAARVDALVSGDVRGVALVAGPRSSRRGCRSPS